MVIAVIFLNFALALVLVYIAWQVRQLQWRLARIADILVIAEQRTHLVLHNAPEAIYIGRQGIQQLRRGNKPLQLQLQQVRQVLIILGLGRQIWGQSYWRFSYPFFRKRAKT